MPAAITRSAMVVMDRLICPAAARTRSMSAIAATKRCKNSEESSVDANDCNASMTFLIRVCKGADTSAPPTNRVLYQAPAICVVGYKHLSRTKSILCTRCADRLFKKDGTFGTNSKRKTSSKSPVCLLPCKRLSVQVSLSRGHEAVTSLVQRRC